MDFLKNMFPKFHSHLRGGTQITRVLGIPGGYLGIPKTRQPYLEGIPISPGIWVWGYPKHGDTQITVTPPSPVFPPTSYPGSSLFLPRGPWVRDCFPAFRMKFKEFQIELCACATLVPFVTPKSIKLEPSLLA